MQAKSPKSETSLREQAVAWLEERLPRGWAIEGDSRVEPTGMHVYNEPDSSKIVLQGPNGTVSTIALEERQSISPREILTQLAPRVETARNMGAHLPLLVLVPWLSKRTQELLAEADINYIDLTGNALLRMDNPPFYLQTAGAERNPTPRERGRAQLRGPKAARLIRLLADVRPPYGVRELAEAASLAPGYVSRLLDTLYSEALIERSPRGPVERVDVAGLLRRWANSYDVFASNEATSFISPAGIAPVLSKLATAPEAIGIAVTGSFAASHLAPVAAPALLLLYSDTPALLADELGLLPADEGANVMLLRPFDPVVFSRTPVEDGLRYASPSQVAVDCLTGSGRMPAEGEAVLEWMRADEMSWRLDSLPGPPAEMR